MHMSVKPRLLMNNVDEVESQLVELFKVDLFKRRRRTHSHNLTNNTSNLTFSFDKATLPDNAIFLQFNISW